MTTCQICRTRAKYGLRVHGFVLLMVWLPNRIVLMALFSVKPRKMRVMWEIHGLYVRSDEQSVCD